MEDTENPTPEKTPQDEAHTPPEPPSAPKIAAGTMIREAREKAGITVAKLCADLRISSATLEALEAGEYGKLAGAPYVRAMMVSLSRHLHLETKDVLKAYADDLGGGQQAPTVQVSPYKDDSCTHAKAHKQIFILLLAVLLFILLLIMGKVNTSAPEAEPEALPATTDTLLNIDPLPEDDSLPAVQDSTMGDSASSAAPAAPAAAMTAVAAKEAAEDAARETRVRIEALTDSVWIRILPAGQRESSRYLRLGKSQEWTHSDAITFITRQSETVEVFIGGRSVIPDNRRFKVDGDLVAY
jgi:cytoskeletal protein RodZ